MQGRVVSERRPLWRQSLIVVGVPSSADLGPGFIADDLTKVEALIEQLLDFCRGVGSKDRSG
jgi:hypothetical protein